MESGLLHCDLNISWIYLSICRNIWPLCPVRMTETPLFASEDILAFSFIAKYNRQGITKRASSWRYENSQGSNLPHAILCFFLDPHFPFSDLPPLLWLSWGNHSGQCDFIELGESGKRWGSINLNWGLLHHKICALKFVDLGKKWKKTNKPGKVLERSNS